MDRDTAVARVKVTLGFKKNLDSQIVQAMIEVQDQLENAEELPYFLRIPYSGLVTVADQDYIDLPANFIQEWDEDQLNMTDEDGEFNLIRDEKGFLRVRYPVSEGTAAPVGYSIVDRKMYFYPTPDDAYPISGTYYAKDDTLATNIENKWLKYLPELIIARAGLLIAAGLTNQTALQIFTGMDGAATQKLNRVTVARDQAGSKPIMGGED